MDVYIPRYSMNMKAILKWLKETEVQAVVLGTAFVIFIYILTSWVLHSIFCVIWPLTILTMVITILFPDTAGSFILNAIPPSLGTMTHWLCSVIHFSNFALQSAGANRPDATDAPEK